MAAEITRKAIRWGVVVVVAAGIALGGLLSERIEERKATRLEERANVRQAVQPPSPGVCTDGVDCYCDSISDPNLLLCEDFEAATLHEDLAAGNWCIDNDGSGAGREPGEIYNVGAGICEAQDEPIYGVWWDETGCGAGRGCNQYVQRGAYDNAGPSPLCVWTTAMPGYAGAASPRGNACTLSGCGAQEYHPTDLWDGNNRACWDIIREGEFNAEVPSWQDPLKPDATRGVFAGRTTGSLRNIAYTPGPWIDWSAGGLAARVSFNRSVQDLGITQATAYSDGIEASGVWGSPWKHDEYGDFAVVANGGDSILRINLDTASPTRTTPFNSQFVGTPGDCGANIAAATVYAGVLGCWGGSVAYWANDLSGTMWHSPRNTGATVYDRLADWPDFNEWKCLRGHFQGVGTTNTTVRVWLDNELIIHFTGLNTQGGFHTRTGYRTFWYDNYANSNGDDDGPHLTAPIRRYMDNLHIREGAPVSCQAIGFP